METIFSIENLIALLTLTFLEIVLGVDNIIFISIFCNKLKKELRKKARNFGLFLAMIFRIVLLSCIKYLTNMTKPLLYIFNFEFSTRDLILLIGGIFLLIKTSSEIYSKFEKNGDHFKVNVGKNLFSILLQIVFIDIIFSFDSILTAIGMTNNLPIMYLAIIISILLMMLFSSFISKIVEKHPSIQILALAFLLLIGTLLVAEAFHEEIPKQYIYFALFFSLSVEALNIKLNKKKVEN